MIDDGRLGLPSASIMHAVAECTGRMALVAQLRAEGKLDDRATPEALSGRRIHEFIAFRRDDLLTDDELDVANECTQIAHALIKEWMGDVSRTVFERKEERLYYVEQGAKLFSGQPDLCVIDFRNARAFVINYKTGRKASDDAADNLQLRTEVVLLKHNFRELQTIDAAIVEPRVDWNPVRVSYNADDLENAKVQILEIVNHAYLYSDTRKAGAWCTYCPARLYCPEAQATVTTLSHESIVLALPRGAAGTRFWEQVKFAKKLIEDIEKKYKEILEVEPDALPGYILPKYGKRHWVVADPRALKDNLTDYLSEDEIDGCATFWVLKLREIFGLKFRLKGDELDKKFFGALGESAKRTYGEPYIRQPYKSEKARLLTQRTENENDE